jgi:hypothetical protein
VRVPVTPPSRQFVRADAGDGGSFPGAAMAARHNNTLGSIKKSTHMEKPTRDSKPSKIWIVLILVVSVVGASLIGNGFDLGTGSWIVGIGIFIVATALWAIAYTSVKQRKFKKYLESLPPEQRLSAMDEYFGGMFSRMMQTPQYKQKEKEIREKLEQRMKSILEKLGNTAGPLSFSAQNQIQAEIKELEIELGQESSPEPNLTLQRTRRENAPRR